MMISAPATGESSGANAVRSAALAAFEAGLSVIPIRDDGTKRPAVTSWAPYIEHRPARQQVATWFAPQRGRTGLAVICGAVSGGLEVLDFDDPQAYEAFAMKARAGKLSAVFERVESGFHARTPGGHHLAYRCETVSGSQKLASRLKRPDEQRSESDRVQVLAETRGEAAYFIAPPSNGKVHPTGRPYEFVSGGFASIAVVTPDEREALLELARSFDALPQPKSARPKPNGSARPDGSDRPGDRFNATANWTELLTRHGWTLHHERNGETFWTRPGKNRSGGWGASTNYQGSNLFYSFSTSTPFEANRGYSLFAALAILEHGGDYAAAARAINSQSATSMPNTGRANRKHASDLHSPSDSMAQPLAPRPELTEEVRRVLCEEALTDSGNALRFCAMHEASARFVYEAGEWITFTGTHWIRDGLRSVQRKAYETARAIRIAAEDLPDERRRELQSHALKLESAPAIRRMLELAAPRLQVRAADLDRHRHLLNCENGTLDLRTFELCDHNPDDLCTRITAAPYDPEAKSDLWDRVLKHAQPEDDERRYLQKLAGITADGETMIDLFVIACGPTRTAKGTVQGGIHAALGSYAATAGLEDFAERRPQAGRATPELARLQGVRIVNVYETPATFRLDAALVKTLSGSDPVTVRELYARPTTYTPQFTLWLATNHRPRVAADDDALWERLREIPFRQQIPPEKRDPTIRARLSNPKQHGAAILAWVIEGLRAYRECGLTTPEGVIRAGKDYRDAMNPVHDFFGDVLQFEPGATIPAADLARFYASWCETNHEKPIAPRRIAAALRAAGCESDRRDENLGEGKRRRVRVWVGVRRA